jgi:hypothetical protein
MPKNLSSEDVAWMMNTFMIELETATARHIAVTEDTLIIDLVDGRTVSAPLAWYPRLLYAAVQERNNWRFIGYGEGIHWPDIDEDISVENVLFGKPSGESRRSFKKWLEQRGVPQRRFAWQNVPKAMDLEYAHP